MKEIYTKMYYIDSKVFTDNNLYLKQCSAQC